MTVLAATAALALTAQMTAAYGDRNVTDGTIFRGDGAVSAGDLAAAQTAEPVQKDFRWTGQVAAGRIVQVKGVLGGIKAEPSSGGEVEVVAVKRGKRNNPDEVRVQVVEHGDGVTICAVYPSGEEGKVNTCEPGDSNHTHVRDNDVQVEFAVRVPAGVRFSGSTVSGSVEAKGMSADVDARTVNGSIRVATTALARAQTVNGSITASVGNANWTNELEFATVNGAIDLSFPANLSTEVHAETVNGNITSDFTVTVQGRFSKRNLSGMIGSGGRDLRLRTVNGNVQIRRTAS
jgi:hypothetical protein